MVARVFQIYFTLNLSVNVILICYCHSQVSELLNNIMKAESIMCPNDGAFD